ncbi:MAG TPA: hypothetical protein VMA72_15670 [Streptosporangiaceae bacterium]|nr:hypothetical protein [Streptosporangiaceae bacterium]
MIRRGLRLASRTALTITAAAGGFILALGIAAAAAAPGHSAVSRTHAFHFRLVPSPGIKSCLPGAGGNVTITTGSLNDTMKVSVHGLPGHTAFDLFVIQTPIKPFGVSWYQTDIKTGSTGTGSATVRGVFDSQTFSVSPGGTTTFAPTHLYHLGLWFNNPAKPFMIGCEAGATSPIVTPFNGDQHAGIQVLNTANFPLAKGPLAHVHP